MARGLVAVDASSLIGLAAVDALDLLERLFGTVAITTAVREEVAAGAGLPGATEVEAAVAAGWIRVVDVGTGTTDFPRLGADEAATLRLAMAQAGGTLVVIDEQLARTRARALGIPVTGLVGVLLAAKREGHVAQVSSFLQRLRSSGFRLSEDLIRTALTQAGEGLRY